MRARSSRCQSQPLLFSVVFTVTSLTCTQWCMVADVICGSQWVPMQSVSCDVLPSAALSLAKRMLYVFGFQCALFFIFQLFKMQSHGTHTAIRLTMFAWLTLNSWSSDLSLPSVGVTAMHSCAQLFCSSKNSPCCWVPRIPVFSLPVHP